MLPIVFFEVYDVVGLEHAQTFATAELMLGDQDIDTVLVAFAIVGADACDRVYWVVVATNGCFGIGFVPLIVFRFGLIFPSWCILEIDGKKLLIKFLILNFTIYNSLII